MACGLAGSHCRLASGQPSQEVLHPAEVMIKSIQIQRRDPRRLDSLLGTGLGLQNGPKKISGEKVGLVEVQTMAPKDLTCWSPLQKKRHANRPFQRSADGPGPPSPSSRPSGTTSRPAARSALLRAIGWSSVPKQGGSWVGGSAS